jgi:hypothetical protein
MGGLQTIRVADLLLDSDNPRHEPIADQTEILDALLEEVGDKLPALAEDIIDHGTSPIELPLVLEDGTRTPAAFIMLEGNRRLATLKLLEDPRLTPRSAIAKRFEALKLRQQQRGIPIGELLCYVVPTRAEAKHWQELRHRGLFEGRGVVPWDPDAIARFFGFAGRRQVQYASTLIDALKKAYPSNKGLQTNLDLIRKKRSTTLGRLLGDPDVRHEVGLVFNDAGVTAHFTSDELEPVFMRIAEDFAGSASVSTVDFKDDRKMYVAGLRSLLPEPHKRRARSRPLATLRRAAPALPPAPVIPAQAPGSPSSVSLALSTLPVSSRPTPRGPRHLFEGVRLSKLGPRVNNILGEVQRLDVDNYPNASAVLTRVVLELAITEVYQKNGWDLQWPSPHPSKQPKDKTLAELVRECLDRMDPTGKDKRWHAVRVGISTPSSMMSMPTLNAWVHDPKFHPVPHDLRLMADNYRDFLAALGTLV